MTKIYLAGDMRSGWQDRLIALLPTDIEAIDPRSHGLSDPSLYTRWDLDGIERANVIVAYMGSNNPSGFGLCIEAGYGYALGKRIIFIDAIADDWRSRYFDMLRRISTVVTSIEDAVMEIGR
ncbi:MAG: hypothetical protein A3E78_12000 [Alphaproteobacteria bacterium RIFCSPHIGHO2_12_FULL_63_12]|nr:MAG: hypothetical protein A3E78_12000 [Alphaproteobacteria bacterium RIFCSPHIGHO2_12_FULL_63_12]